MFIRFDVIHERDRQTDRQTLRDSKDRAYASHRAEKMAISLEAVYKITSLRTQYSRHVKALPSAIGSATKTSHQKWLLKNLD